MFVKISLKKKKQSDDKTKVTMTINSSMFSSIIRNRNSPNSNKKTPIDTNLS